MANVGFLKATQEKIEAVLSAQKNNNFNNNVLEGAFYLTSDSNRLYIGKKDGSNTVIAPINAGIIPVDAIGDLPTDGHPGEFYYIKGSNILCVRSGSSWVQINQVVTNTGLDGAVSQLKNDNGDNLNGANVSFTITDSKGDTQAGTIKIEAKASDKKTLDITPDATTGTIKLTGDAYAMSQAASGEDVEIKLASDFENDSSFKIKKGNNITLTSAADGFTIAAVDTTLEGGSFVADAAASGFSFLVSDSAGNELSDSIDPIVKLQDDTTEYKFANGTMALPVYNKTAIDNLAVNIRKELSDGFKAANAMTYKGTIGSTNSTIGSANLPTTDVSIGDTYLADQTFSIGQTKVPAGGLIIAKAKDGASEDANGHLAAADIEWTVVSGNSTDTTYTINPIAKGIGLKDSHDNTDLGFLNIEAEGVLTAGYTVDAAQNGQTIKITHNKVAADAGTAKSDNVERKMSALTAAYPITAITGLSFDEYGHIAGVTTSTFEVTDTNLTINSATDAVSADTVNKKVTVKTTIAASKSNGDENNVTSSGFAVESLNNNLHINKAENSNTITMNLVWGEFV